MFVPIATVFVSSGCIMMLELVAGRLAARHIGSSLYTWTSVIGVVLAGIALGNYLGGRMAERFAAGRILAALFAVCSGASVSAIILNNLAAQWTFLWRFGLPVHVLSHIGIVFFIPSTVLGMVSPVVVKTALQLGLARGRTVGDIYAAGAAGSIAGTFLAGYWLIAALGPSNALWVIAAVLLMPAILYRPKSFLLYVFAAIFCFLMIAATTPGRWARRLGSALALIPKNNPQILYEAESQYGYVAVQQLSKYPDQRQFLQDNMRIQSRLIMGDIRDLQLFYSKVYAVMTARLAANKKKLCVLGIGGGGYVFPRYIQETWPGSQVDVAEIDSMVTQAAIRAFGLADDAPINTINLDGRNYLDELLVKKQRGEPSPVYDFIYMDAFNALSVPFQLVTQQFNEKLFAALADDGVYMVNLIDMYDSGKLLASFVETAKRTFPYVYVVTKKTQYDLGSNFIIICARQQINLKNLGTDKHLADTDLWVFNDQDFEALKAKNPILLLDDYAPVENLMAPVVIMTAKVNLAQEYLRQAETLALTEKWEDAVDKCRRAVRECPALSIEAYGNAGRILADHGLTSQALAALEAALQYNDSAQFKADVSGIHYNIGLLLRRMGRTEDASKQFAQAMEQLQKNLAVEPDSPKVLFRLGHVLATVGDFGRAIPYFRKALDILPADINHHITLAKALAADKQYGEAVRQLDESIKYMQEHDRSEEAAQLQELRKQIQTQSESR